MERSTPVRKSHTSTADLLVWTETPPAERPAPDADGQGSRPGVRSHQPSGGISAVLYGVQLTDEEAESAMKRKPCSDYKLREITGSGIFSADKEEDAAESGGINSKTGLRLYQQAASTISQISFITEESVSPKKPVSIAEVAKQRELSGSLETEAESRLKKQISDAKCKELSGHDIFGPPPEIPVRPLAARNAELQEKDIEPIPRNLHTSVKVSNPAGGPSNIMIGEGSPPKTSKKIYNQKFTQLSGNDIFKGDATPSSAEKPLSAAKLKEMSGNDIFADGKAASRDYFGGVRKPPGGESSIALV